jgi:hypothetical protein
MRTSRYREAVAASAAALVMFAAGCSTDSEPDGADTVDTAPRSEIEPSTGRADDVTSSSIPPDGQGLAEADALETCPAGHRARIQSLLGLFDGQPLVASEYYEVPLAAACGARYDEDWAASQLPADVVEAAGTVFQVDAIAVQINQPDSSDFPTFRRVPLGAATTELDGPTGSIYVDVNPLAATNPEMAIENLTEMWAYTDLLDGRQLVVGVKKIGSDRSQQQLRGAIVSALEDWIAEEE